MTQPDETEEWLDEITRSWAAVYKKSMTTFVLLSVIREHGPAAAPHIGDALIDKTGWQITERGLYRTLRRLASMDLLATTEIDVARTGAKRKDFELTDLGAKYLERISDELL